MIYRLREPAKESLTIIVAIAHDRFWHIAANPECPLSRQVLEAKRTWQRHRESDVHDPKRSSVSSGPSFMQYLSQSNAAMSRWIVVIKFAENFITVSLIKKRRLKTGCPRINSSY